MGASGDKLKAKEKIGYAMGDVGSLLVFGLVQSVLQKYYTDVLDLRIVQVMMLFTIARIWDAINDPMWGAIVDRMPERKDGRYRHWIVVFAIPVVLSAILMFVKIPGLSRNGYFIWATVTYILFGMIYTCINIPYGSLAQVMSVNAKDRSSLSVFRSVGSVFGGMPAMALISMCYITTAGGIKVMSYKKIIIGVIIISVLSLLAYGLCYIWTRERVSRPPMAKRKFSDIWPTIKVLMTSRPYMAICFVGMLYLASQMFAQSYYSYLFDYYFDKPSLAMLPIVCQYLPVALLMFGMGPLAGRISKRGLCSVGIGVSGVSSLIIYFTHTHNAWVFIGLCLLVGVGNSFIFLLLWSLMGDAMEYNKVYKNVHDDATGYSFFTLMRKIGQTIAAILVNASLMKIGYKDNVLNTDAITDEILDTMYDHSVLIPAVLYLLIFVLLVFVYPLGRKAVEKLDKDKISASK